MPTNLRNDRRNRIRSDPPASDAGDAVGAATGASLRDRNDRVVPSERLGLDFRRAIAAGGPRIEEVYDLRPFPGREQFRPRDGREDAVPLGRGHATGDDQRLLQRREFRHPADHLPLRRLDDRARDQDVRVRVSFSLDDVVAPTPQGLSHEARLAIVLRATVRLDEDLHAERRWPGPYFELCDPVRNSYDGSRVRDDHADRSGAILPESAGGATRVPANRATGTGARATGPREGRETPSPSGEGSLEGEPTRGPHSTPPPEGRAHGAPGGRARRSLQAGTGFALQRLSFGRAAAGLSRFGGTAYPRSAISFTYCVSRYNERTALSVLVNLHIVPSGVAMPAPTS